MFWSAKIQNKSVKSVKSVGKDADRERKIVKSARKKRKCLKICEIQEKVVTLHPLFGVTAVVRAEVLSKSMLRWNDKQFLILYKKWI